MNPFVPIYWSLHKCGAKNYEQTDRHSHTHIHTHTYVHTQDNYSNPYCECKTRFNNVPGLWFLFFVLWLVGGGCGWGWKGSE